MISPILIHHISGSVTKLGLGLGSLGTMGLGPGLDNYAATSNIEQKPSNKNEYNKKINQFGLENK